MGPATLMWWHMCQAHRAKPCVIACFGLSKSQAPNTEAVLSVTPVAKLCLEGSPLVNLSTEKEERSPCTSSCDLEPEKREKCPLRGTISILCQLISKYTSSSYIYSFDALLRPQCLV